MAAARPSLFASLLLRDSSSDPEQRSVERPNSLFGRRCERCDDRFENEESYVAVDGKNYHEECFRCAQCFCQLSDQLYFNQDGRYYCEYDFGKLFAPICAKCNEIAIGHVVKAVTGSYHSDCFMCEECGVSLAEGVWVVDAKLFCFDCKENIPKESRYSCRKCKHTVERFELQRHNGDYFHFYHFKCTRCGESLKEPGREIKEDLFCVRCYDLNCDICADCKMPIDREHERSVTACGGKHYHFGHHRCVACGVPFNGNKHLEKNKKAYCEADYMKLFGERCSKCNARLSGQSISLFSKSWCRDCYSCLACDRPLNLKDKVMEEDQRPMCKSCFTSKRVKKMIEEREQRRTHNT